MEQKIKSPIKVITTEYTSATDESLINKIGLGNIAIGNINGIPRILGNISDPTKPYEQGKNIVPLDGKNIDGTTDFTSLLKQDSSTFNEIEIIGVITNTNQLYGDGAFAEANINKYVLYIIDNYNLKQGRLYKKIKSGQCPNSLNQSIYWSSLDAKTLSDSASYNLKYDVLRPEGNPSVLELEENKYVFDDLSEDGKFKTLSEAISIISFKLNDLSKLKTDNKIGYIIYNVNNATSTDSINIRKMSLISNIYGKNINNFTIKSCDSGKIVINVPEEYYELFKDCYISTKFIINSKYYNNFSIDSQTELFNFSSVAIFNDYVASNKTIEIYHKNGGTSESVIPMHTSILLEIYK